ncbi:hypothetical protein IEQ34_006929 [Dendrobium chrysotoxum]|uniref:Uncharacterized protein n=1 Tax=Dendrobium chrysotoxum TaxID=161865 RepID=A0AAV7H861_DENCH|nr:hypothetical protein IEQ34_006929 [Dendrobium chrysotoxum]
MEKGGSSYEEIVKLMKELMDLKKNVVKSTAHNGVLLSSHYPAMISEASHLHMLFFPFMAPGHMLPMVDMAKIFAARGICVTILTTPANATIIHPSIDDSFHLHIIHFPSVMFSLPSECENRSLIFGQDQLINFFKPLSSLCHSFDYVLRDSSPDCIVTDLFLPWTYYVATTRGIP